MWDRHFSNTDFALRVKTRQYLVPTMFNHFIGKHLYHVPAKSQEIYIITTIKYYAACGWYILSISQIYPERCYAQSRLPNDAMGKSSYGYLTSHYSKMFLMQLQTRNNIKEEVLNVEILQFFDTWHVELSYS